jgi:hypothetical protein
MRNRLETLGAMIGGLFPQGCQGDGKKAIWSKQSRQSNGVLQSTRRCTFEHERSDDCLTTSTSTGQRLRLAKEMASKSRIDPWQGVIVVPCEKCVLTSRRLARIHWWLITELFHGNILSNIEFLSLFFGEIGVLDSFDRANRKQLEFDVNDVSFDVGSSRSHRWRFSAARKGENDCEGVNCGWTSENWVETPSVSFLSDLIHDWSFRGEMKCAEIMKMSPIVPC